MLESSAPGAHLLRLLKRGGAVLAALFVIIVVILATHWPFTRKAAIYSLERVSSSEVHIGRFRKIFFPHPGYVIEDLRLIRHSGPGTPPLVSVRRFTCRGSWLAVFSFTHRVKQIRLEAMHVYIPDHVPPPARNHPSAKIETTVTELVADGAILEVASGQPSRGALRFDFSRLVVADVARGKSMGFSTVLHNPQPPGEITAGGTFGPLPTHNPGEAPVHGSFNFTHADLSQYHVISGTLSAHGTFDGRLAHLEVRGQTDIPNFEVTRSRHALDLSAEYDAIVNGLNGDVAIQSGNAHLLRTTVQSRGSLTTGPSGHGKTLSLDLNSREARIQDLLRLFVKGPRPPLNGFMMFRARVVLPPEKEPFLRRVRLEGDFGISDAQFANPHTEEKVDELSARARSKKEPEKEGEDPARTVSDLKGHVLLRKGAATFSKASFGVPGALARVEGNYNL